MSNDLKALQTHAREQLEKMRPADGTPATAEPETTAYAVNCRTCGKVCLTHDEYMRQLCRPDSVWSCPKCGDAAQFDDDHYEAFLDGPDEDSAPDVHDEHCHPSCACAFGTGVPFALRK